MINILFTSAGRRNYLLCYFKKAMANKGLVMAADASPLAPALMAADKSFVLPLFSAPEYISKLLKVCVENQVHAIISLNDLELPLLAEHKSVFEDRGITVIVSTQKVIETCFDKWKTHQFILQKGLKSPKSFLTLANAKQALKTGEMSFPLVIKPRWGTASICIEFLEDMEELELAYRLVFKRLMRTSLAEISQKAIHACILIQEKILGEEYGLDVINDLNGNYVASIAKQKLAMRAGETDKAVTKISDQLFSLGEIIGSNLKHIAILDVDVFYYKGSLYVLEMNPRFGGHYPFSHIAGANVPKAIIKWLNGENPPPECFIFSDRVASAKYYSLVKVPY